MDNPLRMLRKSLGMTQKEMAEIAGLNITTYQGCETRGKSLNIESGIEIAKKLSVSLDRIYFGECNNLTQLKHITRQQAEKLITALDWLAGHDKEVFDGYRDQLLNVLFELEG